jgi:hypothetical protein
MDIPFCTDKVAILLHGFSTMFILTKGDDFWMKAQGRSTVLVMHLAGKNGREKRRDQSFILQVKDAYIDCARISHR